MKVLFIQKQTFPYYGIMSMSGYLKRHGHICDCLIDNLDLAHRHTEELRQADIIGISVLSVEHRWLKDTVRKLRAVVPDTPVIIGGIHAILYPEILETVEADLLCMGEGEAVVKNLLDKINAADLDFSGIAGLAYRKDGKIVKNKMPGLRQEFDWPEDRNVYYRRYKSLAGEEQKQFLTGRGCPYKCNFCFNAQLQEKYSGLGKYLRKKPVDLCIQEILKIKTDFGINTLFFSDDTFAIDKGWLLDFLDIYRRKVQIPFMCIVRANEIDREVAQELSRSGCHTVSMGIETSNEEIRRNTLNKDLDNETIRSAARHLKKNNIRLQTSNMFGIPGETVENALETVRFNMEVGTSFAFAAMLMPFPGSNIEKKALELDWLDAPVSFESLPQSFFSGSVFKHPEVPILENIKSAHLFIAYPRLYKIFKVLIRLRCRPLFLLLDRAGLFLRYKKERKLSFPAAARLFYRFRKSQ